MPDSGLAIALHVGAMVAVMGVVAVLVYEYVGVAVLPQGVGQPRRRLGGGFVLAGVLTLFT